MCIYIHLPKNNRVHTPIFLGSSNFIHYDLMVGLKQEFRLKQTEATSTMKSHRLTSLFGKNRNQRFTIKILTNNNAQLRTLTFSDN